MSLIDGRTTRILFTVSLFALGVGFLYVAHRSLIVFLFAVFFAYLVDPAVSRVEKWTKGRPSAIAVIYLLIVLILGTFFFFVGPRIGHETQKLTESLPALLERVGSGQIAEQIGAEHGLSVATRRQLSDFLASHRNDLLHLAQRAGLRVAEVAQQSWLLIVVPILAGFFLKDAHTFSQVALSLVSTKPQREFLQGVISDMNQMLADFIRAQLTLAALSWVAYASFLGLIMHVPFALRLIQDYVVTPQVMGKNMELHPLAAIFGVLAGGEIAGVLGVYLSIPVMASLRIVWRRWRMYAEKRRFGPLNEYSFITETTPRK